MLSTIQQVRKRRLALLLFMSVAVSGSSLLFPPDAEGGWRALGLSGVSVNEVHVVDSYLFVGTSDGVYRGFRFGVAPNWIPIGLQGTDVPTLAVLNRDTIITGTSTGANALYRTTNGGTSWGSFDSGFSMSGFRPVFDLAFRGGATTVVYAATTGPGNEVTIEVSTDAGTSWNPIWSESFAVFAFQFVHVDATFPSVLWAGGETGFLSPWLIRSYDSGNSWTWAAVVGTGDNRCHDIAVDPNDSNGVWVSMEGQVQHSSDGGASWAIVHTSNHYLYSIAIDTLRTNRLYTSGGALGRALRYTFTTDGGTVWHQVAGPSPASIVCHDLDVHSEVTRTYVYFATSDGVLEFLDPLVYICGDTNADGMITSSDIIFVVNCVFKSGPPPAPFPSVADVNCGGSVTSSDIIELVNVVFKSGQFSCAQCPTGVAKDGL